MQQRRTKHSVHIIEHSNEICMAAFHEQTSEYSL